MASSSSSSPSSPLPSLQARQDHPGAAMVAPQGSPQTPLTTDHEDNQTKAVRCRLIRQTSDILRSPHIDVKELRICVGTWNVGGICPPTDLDIQEWLDTEEPADIYVLGFQEIIPLEVGYMIGSEDNRPVAVWEHIIGETLNKKCPDKSRFKYYSAPPSPSNSNPSDYAHVMDDEFLSESNKDNDGVHPLIELDTNTAHAKTCKTPTCASNEQKDKDFSRVLLQTTSDHSQETGLERLRNNLDESSNQKKSTNVHAQSERLGMVWPGQPLDMLAHHLQDSAKSSASAPHLHPLDLASGEKDGDELKRNAHAEAIHKRTMFNPVSTAAKSEGDHRTFTVVRAARVMLGWAGHCRRAVLMASSSSSLSSLSRPFLLARQLQQETAMAASRSGGVEQKQLWNRVVLRKWLNIGSGLGDSDFSADECGTSDGETDREGNQMKDGTYRLRRQQSEILLSQHTDVKELRVYVGTWNVGGIFPPSDLDIQEWLDMEEPADVYVFGFQEIVPLNAGNIFGAEDTRPVAVWEHIIRETLNKSCPEKSRFRCHSYPPSQSRCGLSDYDLAMEDAYDDLHSDSESNNDSDGELHLLIKKDTTVINKSGVNGQTSKYPSSTSNERIQKLKDFSSTPSRKTVDHLHDLGYEKLKCDTSEPTNRKKSASVKVPTSSASLKSTDESFTDFPEDDLACEVNINDRIKRKRPECDRILSYGKGIRLLSYKRGELTLSDHRPVSAVYVVEVEAFRRRKFQRALTFTDAQVQHHQ
ncbi:hypothetical protein PR202_ga05782 [Eleusine coracana subsp. coracana]|uniref:Inositol polyphosphate-related phosphatase domain-containing protein n=1 Tax=Eleusine coracana subsp. coracana TaxID=191504 RepID=A0AAV5BVS9_ELECO|nr:hypothetical protein PR202_ga05782 [Eleusine coracana subsp. coracana]